MASHRTLPADYKRVGGAVKGRTGTSGKKIGEETVDSDVVFRAEINTVWWKDANNVRLPDRQGVMYSTVKVYSPEGVLLREIPLSQLSRKVKTGSRMAKPANYDWRLGEEEQRPLTPIGQFPERTTKKNYGRKYGYPSN